MPETTAPLATVPESPPPTAFPFPMPEPDMVVLARNPQEVEAAQKQLVAWVEARIAQCRHALAESEENVAHAKKRKWKITGWQSRALAARHRLDYYGRMREALAAGYFIMPDLPIEIFAIRTSKRKPLHEHRSSEYQYPRLGDQVTDIPPGIGAGRYASPVASASHWTETVKSKDGTKDVKQYHCATDGFEEPDFPMKLVKPQILDDTGKAMALRIFDEIGIIRPQSQQRHRDPIIVGRIRQRGLRGNCVSFLLSWWIDTRDL